MKGKLHNGDVVVCNCNKAKVSREVASNGECFECDSDDAFDQISNDPLTRYDLPDDLINDDFDTFFHRE